jgi:hypothetical protein
MTDYGAQIVTYLKTDTVASPIVPGTPLETLLPGGIYNYPDTGRKGLTRLLSPQAFSESQGVLRPTAVVLQHKEIVDGQIVDPVSGYNSTVTPIMIWVYDNGFTTEGYTNIEAACNRIYRLLAFTQLTGMYQILWDGYKGKGKREPLLKDAAFWSVGYNVYASQSFP